MRKMYTCSKYLLDNILFTGSATTKKIKMYVHAQKTNLLYLLIAFCIETTSRLKLSRGRSIFLLIRYVPANYFLSINTYQNSTFAVFSLIKYDAKAYKKEREKKHELKYVICSFNTTSSFLCSTMKENMAATAIEKLKSVSYAHILASP